jgi:hypothetical protein
VRVIASQDWQWVSEELVEAASLEAKPSAGLERAELECCECFAADDMT